MRKNRKANERLGLELIDYHLFGDYRRYKLIHYKSNRKHIAGDVWMVTDAESIDDLGLPAVIRQSTVSEVEAKAGLQ